jgi:8-oxo-dGTP pyrophosphatase MutT (NUDIX family)
VVNKLSPLFFKMPPFDLKTSFSDFACVAVILKPNSENFDLAFIRRAHNPKDPWSGQIAFPGGRSEPHDTHDLMTAIRETKEEVGWSLTDKNFLGYLTDIQARNRLGLQNFFLRPIAFYSQSSFAFNTIDKNEVDEVFWVPINHLSHIKNQTIFSPPGRSELNLPGITFPTGDTLWGLTLSITKELIAIMNCL